VAAEVLIVLVDVEDTGYEQCNHAENAEHFFEDAFCAEYLWIGVGRKDIFELVLHVFE